MSTRHHGAFEQHSRRTRVAPGALLAASAALVGACSDSGADPAQDPSGAPAALTCDDSLKTVFKPDADTVVTLVKAFRRGEPIALPGTPSTPAPATAPHDLCLVKLNIGPGNPGPADAPSTSAGIGVEVWLPEPGVWSQRMQLWGDGGYSGRAEISDLSVIGAPEALNTAITDKAVSAMTDTGHTTGAFSGAFGMNPDGSINTTLMRDFAENGVHQMTLKVKALAQAYYARPPQYSYFRGCSGGGRDGYSLAQLHPEHFDGILSEAPGINWNPGTTSILYPQIVIQRDLGGTPLTAGQRALLSAAAVSACDSQVNGQHDGYLSDPSACRYDPTQDLSVLCRESGGTNDTAACVSTVQARAMAKMWYGPTTDGSVPDPAVDNGKGVYLSPNQLWFGYSHGADLGWAGGGSGDPIFFGPCPHCLDTLALAMQDPTIASQSFVNATGRGADGWKELSYGDFAAAHYQTEALQPWFGQVNTDNPDLSGLRARGGKLLVYQGAADQLVPLQGLVNYYTRSSNAAGGFVESQKFHRLFIVPGLGHCSGVGMDGIGGVSPSAASNTPIAATSQMFQELVDWVESGVAPDRIVISTADSTNSRPLCPYPKKVTYIGGNVNVADSYRCE